MRTGTTDSLAGSINGFSRVVSLLTFRRHRRRAAHRVAAQPDAARWTQTYWGREFMKSL